MISHLSHNSSPVNIEQLLSVSDLPASHIQGELLDFITVDGHDVYNITAPFEYDGKKIIAGRTELRCDELRTVTKFYKEIDGVWAMDNTLPTLPLQDPFITKINDTWVVGGVKVYESDINFSEVETWETHLYTGQDLCNLSLLMIGPNKMKDIRLLELPDGSIGVFTRPQGDYAGRGKIGFTTVPSLDCITPDVLLKATIIPQIFTQDEWGGVNEAYVLEDGRIGVLGHIARYVESARQYYPITFIFDPITFDVTNLQIIASRANLPITDAKRPDLVDVIFPGGLVAFGKLATLYAGVSDTRAAKLEHIPNPFYDVRRSSTSLAS